MGFYPIWFNKSDMGFPIAFFRAQVKLAVMGAVSQSEFQEDLRAPLIDPNTTNSSTEFWLIQWPKHHVIPDFDGQELSLDLRKDDGQLGTFEVPSGEHKFKVSFWNESCMM
ncbi:hypothetical protein CTI12_AA498460 [Artemisia annua]|uniref:Uncharacterized protein n=1 Tax=Artemisia annua TaxID=35608 RepID=A0A2U1LER7_ARTAN|nr:hypothetical protein CTI12_AA498460 [Artemisia annua]